MDNEHNTNSRCTLAQFGSTSNVQTQNEEHKEWKKVLEFYQNEFLCDLKLKVGHASRSAHRIVLSSLCPHGPWSHIKTPEYSGSSRKETVHIDVSDTFRTPETFTTIIDYIYSGSINLSTDTVWEILDVAIQLKLSDLVSHCSQFLLELVRVENVLSVWNFAYDMGLRQLGEVCKMLSRELFRDILVDSNDVKLLSVSFMEMFLDQKYVTETVKSKELGSFILKWLLEDPKERMQAAISFISDIGLRHLDLCLICESLCQNDEIKSSILKGMLSRGCPSSLKAEKSHSSVTRTNDCFLNIDPTVCPNPESQAPSMDLTSRSVNRNGAWVIMIRDSKCATVFCQDTNSWLEFPTLSYPFINGLSNRKLLACSRRSVTRSLQIVDISRLDQPNSSEEVRLLNDFLPEPEYLWYLCNQRNWFPISLVIDSGKYSLVLYEWNDSNSGFVHRCHLRTSLPVQYVIKGFTYFNLDPSPSSSSSSSTLLLVIASPISMTYRHVKICDLFYVYRVTWNAETLIEELVKDLFSHHHPVLTENQFMYHNGQLYLFERAISTKLTHAIEFNASVTINAMIYDLNSEKSGTSKSFRIPSPSFGIFPIKPKIYQCPHSQSMTETPNPNISSSTTSDPNQKEYISAERFSEIFVLGDKFFLLLQRTPGILQTFVLNIFQKTWQLTPPVPLAALSEIRANSFYSDCSLHGAFPVGKKRFESENIPIFKNWCLQQWQGGVEIKNGSV